MGLRLALASLKSHKSVHSLGVGTITMLAWLLAYCPFYHWNEIGLPCCLCCGKCVWLYYCMYVFGLRDGSSSCFSFSKIS